MIIIFFEMEGYSWHTVSIVTSVLNNHILANVLQTVFPSKSEVCHYSIQQCTGLTNEIIRRKYRQDQGGMLIREDDMAERIMMNVSGPYTKIGK